MNLSVEEMTTPLTSDDVKTAIYDMLTIVGFDVTSWKTFGVVRTIIHVFAILVAACSVYVCAIGRAGFLDYARGEWLTSLARYVYQTIRIEATFATGTLTLTNSSAFGYGPFAAGDLEFPLAGTEVVYRNTQAIASLGAMSSLQITVASDTVGAAASAAAGALTTLSVTLLGVTCVNAAAIRGIDTESDASLVQRCYLSVGPLSPKGPRAAYSYAALSAKLPDGSPAGITRIRTEKPGNGRVIVYCGTPSGGITGVYTDPATPLGAAHKNIQDHAVSLCITEDTISATKRILDVSYRLWAYDTIALTSAQIQAEAERRLGEFMASRPVGGDVISGEVGRVYLSALRAVLRFHPDIFRVEIVASADIDLNPYDDPVIGSVVPTQITLQAA